MDHKPHRRSGPRVLAGVALALSLAGCSSLNPGTAEAADVASRFHADLASGDFQAACTLLAPGTVEKLEDGAAGSCARKLADLGLPGAGGVRSSQAYGSNAQVQLEADTVFLTLSGRHWKITAIGCTPRGEKPYDCEVEGN
ncbi:hypothetical protein [Arthrobacter mangrovi]|uniref:Lipoprotein n=1 Tax=Arthrobacter mangrovi TaxID=2966350 RepID=A0ABQ5MRK1_9MICC|nr:hypothetical protein [Arthrobacter mangrovi]GLB66618.1 hypothetical protein AHIS1636_10570 [Arthrobacter mangrovi]